MAVDFPPGEASQETAGEISRMDFVLAEWTFREYTGIPGLLLARGLGERGPNS